MTTIPRGTSGVAAAMFAITTGCGVEEEGEVASAALSRLTVDQPVVARGWEGEPHRLSLLHGRAGDDTNRGEAQLYLADGAEVIEVVRARDHAEDGGYFVVRGPRDHDYLVEAFDFGGPGTCVWGARLEISTLVSDLPGSPLQEVKSIETGGYLGCADGSARSCGCGTWQASWTATTDEAEVIVEIEPVVTYADPSAPPVAPPPRNSFRL